MGFEAYNPEQLPPSIAGDFGQLLASASGALQDEELDLLSSAAMQRLPARCADDALDTLGEIFRIGRYAGESHDSYRARLVAAWPTWEIAGSPVAIETQIRAFGIPDVRVYTEADDLFCSTTGANFSRFDVVIGPDFGALAIVPMNLGSWTLGDAGTLGSSATRAQIETVKRIVLKWKSAHGYPVNVIVIMGTSGAVLGVGEIGETKPLTLGDFALGDGDATIITWHMGRILSMETTTLGSWVLAGYEV